MNKLILSTLLGILAALYTFSASSIPQSIQIHKSGEIINGEFSTSFLSPALDKFVISIPMVSDTNVSDIQLITPSGVVINSENASSYNCNFLFFTPLTPEEHLISLENSLIIELNNVASGKYVITGKASGPQNLIPIRIKFPTSKIHFALTVGEVGPNKKPISVGNMFPVFVQLFDDSVPPATAEASFEFVKDGAVVSKIIAVDDGSGMDFEARDGIYHAFFTPEAEGEYTVLVRVNGTNLNGERFEVSVDQSFNTNPY